ANFLYDSGTGFGGGAGIALDAPAPPRAGSNGGPSRADSGRRAADPRQTPEWPAAPGSRQRNYEGPLGNRTHFPQAASHSRESGVSRIALTAASDSAPVPQIAVAEASKP